MESTVLTERRDDGILLIGINRPEANNRMDPPTYIALGQALHELEHDDQLRVGVYTRPGPTSSRWLVALVALVAALTACENLI